MGAVARAVNSRPVSSRSSPLPGPPQQDEADRGGEERHEEHARTNAIEALTIGRKRWRAALRSAV
jgi:hypothetical protein